MGRLQFPGLSDRRRLTADGKAGRTIGDAGGCDAASTSSSLAPSRLLERFAFLPRAPPPAHLLCTSHSFTLPLLLLATTPRRASERIVTRHSRRRSIDLGLRVGASSRTLSTGEDVEEALKTHPKKWFLRTLGYEGRFSVDDHVCAWRRGQVFEDEEHQADNAVSPRPGDSRPKTQPSGEGKREEETVEQRKRKLRMRRNAEVALRDGRQAFQTPPRERTEAQVEQIRNICVNVLKNPFLVRYPHSVQLDLVRHMQLECFQNHEVVFHQGEVGKKFYILAVGRVRVSESVKARKTAAEAALMGRKGLNGEGGRTKKWAMAAVRGNTGRRAAQIETTVADLKEGESFGELALMGGGVRTATVKAIEPNTMLLTLEKEEFLTCLAEENAKAITEKVLVMRQIQAFADMPEEELQDIAKYCMLRSYPKGHIFYPEQENHLYILASGEANICVPTIVFGKEGDKSPGEGIRDAVEDDLGASILASCSGRVGRAGLLEVAEMAAKAAAGIDARLSKSTGSIDSKRLFPLPAGVQRRMEERRKSKTLDDEDDDEEKPREVLRVIHRIFKPGEIFGEGCVFPNHAGGLAVVAKTEIRAIWISKLHFHAHIPSKIQDILNGELMYRMELVEKVHRSAKERLKSVVQKSPDLGTYVSDRLTVYSKCESALGSWRATVNRINVANVAMKALNRLTGVSDSASKSGLTSHADNPNNSLAKLGGLLKSSKKNLALSADASSRIALPPISRSP